MQMLDWRVTVELKMSKIERHLNPYNIPYDLNLPIPPAEFAESALPKLSHPEYGSISEA